MNKLNNKGFEVIEGLLILVIVVAIGCVGWYVWDIKKTNSKGVAPQQSSEIKDSPQTVEGVVVTFKNESEFDPKVKQEILAKVIEPLVYYEKVIVKNDKLKSLDIKVSDDEVYKYDLKSYEESESFLFGADNKIQYWMPPLCDGVECQAYTEAFMQKYPDNYKAYLACEKAEKAGDNEKQYELACR